MQAEQEVAELRESLTALHHKLQHSAPHKSKLSFAATPSRTRFPLVTSLRFVETPSKPIATPSRTNLTPVVEGSLLESPPEVERMWC